MQEGSDVIRISRYSLGLACHLRIIYTYGKSRGNEIKYNSSMWGKIWIYLVTNKIFEGIVYRL